MNSAAITSGLSCNNVDNISIKSESNCDVGASEQASDYQSTIYYGHERGVTLPEIPTMGFFESVLIGKELDGDVPIKIEPMDDNYVGNYLPQEATRKAEPKNVQKEQNIKRDGRKRRTKDAKPKEAIVCEKCKITFKKIANLNRHKKSVHAVNEQSTCRICHKIYRSKIHLENHERKVHSELFEPIQTCDVCNKDFKSKAYLRRHISEVHPENEELIQCNECTKRFKTVHHLKIHIRRMHPPIEKRVPCNICGKVFSCNLYMMRHCETLHLASTSPYVCTKCTMPFNTPSHLKKHLLHEHCQDNKVKCDKCDRYYLDDNKLRKHKYRTHIEKEPETCPVCNRQYKSKEVLKNHLRAVHGPEFCCKFCGRGFESDIFLFMHIQGAHMNCHLDSMEFNGFCESMDQALPALRHILNSGFDIAAKKRKYAFARLGCGNTDGGQSSYGKHV